MTVGLSCGTFTIWPALALSRRQAAREEGPVVSEYNGKMSGSRRGDPSDTGLDKYVRRRLRQCAKGLTKQCCITLHDEVRDPFVTRPRCVGDHNPAPFSGDFRCRRNGIIVIALNTFDTGTMPRDRSAARLADSSMNKDDAVRADELGALCDRPAVVAVGGTCHGHTRGESGDLRRAPLRNVHWTAPSLRSEPKDELYHCVGSTQCFEATETQSLSFVLDVNGSDIQSTRNGRKRNHRGRRGPLSMLEKVLHYQGSLDAESIGIGGIERQAIVTERIAEQHGVVLC